MKVLPGSWSHTRQTHFTQNGTHGLILLPMKRSQHFDVTVLMAFNQYKQMLIIQMKLTRYLTLLSSILKVHAYSACLKNILEQIHFKQVSPAILLHINTAIPKVKIYGRRSLMQATRTLQAS